MKISLKNTKQQCIIEKKITHKFYTVGMTKQFTPPGLHLLVQLPMACPSLSLCSKFLITYVLMPAMAVFSTPMAPKFSN